MSHASPATARSGASSLRGLTSAATKLTLLSVGTLGVSCIATQLVLMREMLCVFAGNELVLGIILANWLLLMGAGAWLAQWSERLKDRLGCFLGLQVWIAVIPVALLFAARSLRLVVFAAGTAVDIQGTVLSSFLVLLPYCVPAGFLLALACKVVAEEAGSANNAGRVYVADSLGSILGGAVVSLALLRLLDSFALLAVVGFVPLLALTLLGWRWRRRWILAVVVMLAAFLAWVFTQSEETNSRQLEYASATLLFQGNSPYGELVVTRENHQTNFIQNGLPVLSTHNTEQVEEAVHYAMAQRPDARRVLLIGGGVAGTAKELLKYPAEVTYVELDPLFLELGRRLLPKNLADPRIHVVNTDGRRFVQTTDERFGVILLDLADPVTAQLNRFHTVEFFAEAKRVLTTNGVLVLAVGRYQNFVSPELARVLATEHYTLQSAFTNVVMVPGGRVFFLASDGELETDIAARLERARIPTQFVNRNYLDAMLTPDRLADLERAVLQPPAMNRDFNPALYFNCLRHWASQFDTRLGVVGIVVGLALLTYVVRLRGAAAAVFASGFAASSLEVVLLLGFQALCGSLYYQLGIIVTVFMTGLAVGAAWANHGSGQRGLLIKLALGVTLFAALLPSALKLLSKAPLFGGSALVVQIAIGLLTFALAALVGAEFPVANRTEHGSVRINASRLYTADFLGASMGALLASAWLIPVLGVTKMCWIAAGLNLLAAATVVSARQSDVAASR